MILKSLYPIDNRKKSLVGREVSLLFDYSSLINFVSFFFIESQLQLAIINQVYCNEKQPEEIFGSVQLNLVDEMIDSIELWNRNISLPFCYATLPPNFV
jgi:hypothetical protein